MYHFAPNARRPWHWLTAGSIVAVLLWVLATWAFAEYVSRFGRYEALYAGLGAPVVLLLVVYLTGLALLLGGEINAEIDAPERLHAEGDGTGATHRRCRRHDTTVRDT